MSSNTEEEERQLEGLGMNIVHQIGDALYDALPKDVAHDHFVDARQATNDMLIDFTKKLIAQHDSTLKAEYEEKVREARLEENAWSRQQMIVAQALEAPNSGFGRMIRWSIDLFNKRKLELLDLTQPPKEGIQ